MKKITPSLPSGFRDFGPKEIHEKRYIIDIIENYFQLYGFEPIETPSIEKLSILTEKYGEEGNQLIFKILNSGDFLKNTQINDPIDHKKLTLEISNKALRYDLTVPLARYLSMNREKHPLPFKRYQIQPVWRADRPQKGRYREFYQCDVDILGTKSILAEAELITLASKILTKLKVPNFKIKINHRALLKCISKKLDVNEKKLAIAIDKIDKIGIDKALEGLSIEKEKLKYIKEILSVQGNNKKKIDFLKKLLNLDKERSEDDDEVKTLGNFALFQFEELFKCLTSLNCDLNQIEINTTIARGLDYYTGIVFEFVVENSGIGSIGGGGRYDDMAEMFGLKDVSGVGFAFGLDRIWDILKDKNLIPELEYNKTQILITNFDKNVIDTVLNLSSNIIDIGIKCELFHETSSIKKQLNYANKRNIPFVIIIGEDEKNKNKFILKNMTSGDQKVIDLKNYKNILDLIKE